MLKKSTSLFLAVVILALPLLIDAQETANAVAQAQVDAANDVNSTLWMGAGCLFGILGVGAAYVIEPSPKAARLLGKSPEYVAAYTDAYKQKAKSVQTSNAWIGCLVGSALYLLLILATPSD
ncbi:hypothetical protein KAW96_08195 [candidate division WOR-3 bacterium]|nr:hypothetical protein [candidate division WOR-3 bacterium]